VVAALLEAATKLFAEVGPGVVSLRDVAKEANVNLGLIHRYIGSKQDLLAAVLAARPGMPPTHEVALSSADDIVDVILQQIAADAPYTRIMLRAAIEGFELRQLQDVFPLTERAAKSARAGLPRRDADVRVALLVSAILGWQAIGPAMLEVLKHRNLSDVEIDEALRPALAAFLNAEPS